jgi:hypothetical protein
MRHWQDAFSKSEHFSWDGTRTLSSRLQIRSLRELKTFLDMVHTKHCLLRPFFEQSDYPLVESRELLPSFESDTFEYKDLPGFSLVALARPLNYFQEIFQFDILHNILDESDNTMGLACPLEQTVIERNVQSLYNRLPKQFQEDFRKQFQDRDVTDLEHYSGMLPYLLELDRGQVMAMDNYGNFHLNGVYASFPSDLDTEIKRFGLRIGKFEVGDNVKYELHRLFVYQFLMELYGFPIVSERRTSAALFSRRLHKLGENFLIRVLGQSDRTLTTMYSAPGSRRYPKVEKLALVKVQKEQKDVIERLREGGYFVDEKELVVILRVRYQQHKFNPNNVRQERALSVDSQEIVHPLTGESLTGLNLIKDTYNMFLRLNDIVRGEYKGRIIYKRHEVVENTDTEEKRLKFLYAWLSKHQRRIIGYSDEFYANVTKVLDTYLLNADNYESFQNHYELFQEVWTKYSYIQQARKIKSLQDLQDREVKGQKINYLDMLQGAAELLHELKFEIVNYFDELVMSAINMGEELTNNSYLIRNYVDKKDEELTEYGREIKQHYRKVVSLVDEFRSIRKSRTELSSALMQQAV